MDSNLKDSPILHYVVSQLNSGSHRLLPQEFEEPLLIQFPHLNHPAVSLSMIQALPNNIRDSLAMLSALGPRPDPSAVTISRAKISDVESKLQENIQAITSHSLVKDDVNRIEMEKEFREAPEKEMQICRAVVRLEEMHETYEKQLRDAEETLIEVYGSVVAELEQESESEVNEEVLKNLKEAEYEVIETVALSGRQLRFLPEEFGKLHGLRLLNISSNQLEVIPDSIAGLKQLEELDVSSNLLESLPDSIGLLINLRILNVSGNQLNMLPESVGSCSSLMELDTSFNNLICLPMNIGHGLVNLEKLSIHLNKIQLLPSSICEMRSLRYLDAHFNELHGLPASIGRLTNLEVLNVSSNFSDLTVIPESIGDLHNLREFDLSNNQIRALPDTFGRLEKLTRLNLDGNPLIIPPMEIVNKGVEAVKGFMAKRWLDIIAEEEQRSMGEIKQQPESGWLSWGSSMLNNLVSEISQNVTGIVGDKTYKDPWLDQQL